MTSTPRRALAIRTILVTFRAAVESLAHTEHEADIRVLQVEQARDRALDLLHAIEVDGGDDPWFSGALTKARRQIESEILEL